MSDINNEVSEFLEKKSMTLEQVDLEIQGILFDDTLGKGLLASTEYVLKNYPRELTKEHIRPMIDPI